MFETDLLAAWNSATKYPSIPTYHALGDRGVPVEECLAFPAKGMLIATEKVDGTNARIVIGPDGDYLIGSREDLLLARGDRVGNPAMGIVGALRPLADRLADSAPLPGRVRAFYLEVYGHKIGGQAKQYTGTGAVGHRLFDVATIDAADPVLGASPASVSAWRDAGGPRFAAEPELGALAAELGVPLVPRWEVESLPTGVAEAHRWLSAAIVETAVALDDRAGKRPEGLVVRTPDRRRIAKLRFEDYERAARRSKGRG